MNVMSLEEYHYGALLRMADRKSSFRMGGRFYFQKGRCVAVTNRMKKFCEEYLIDLNATQAAIRAGYSVKSASTIGQENLQKPEIQNEIQRLTAIQSRRTGITADRILMELAKIAFVNPMNVLNSDGTIKASASDDDKSAIQGIKYRYSDFDNGSSSESEVRLYDKTKALELLGRHLGLFDSKIQIQGNVPVVIMGGDSLED